MHHCKWWRTAGVGQCRNKHVVELTEICRALLFLVNVCHHNPLFEINCVIFYDAITINSERNQKLSLISMLMLRSLRFWTLMPELSVTCIAEDNNALLHCISLRIAIIIRSAPRWTVKLWALQTCSSTYFMYNLLKKVPIPGASRNAALSHCGANNTLPVLTLSVVHAIPKKTL